MKIKILLIVILGMVGLVGASPNYYEFQLEYDLGEINIENIDVVFIEDEFLNFEKEYYLEIVNKDKNVLEKKYFSVPKIVFVDEGEDGINGGYSFESENLTFKIYAPYHEEGYKANIYDKNNTLLASGFVSQFSKVFDREDYLGIEKKDSEMDEEKKFEDVSRKSEQNKVYINLLIGVLIILLILLIWIFIRKK